MLTKNSLKKFLSLLVCLVMLFPYAVFSNSIDDVKGHWAEQQIRKWTDRGYINKYDDGSFRPDSPISRAEFMAIVNRSFSFTDKADIEYKDLKASVWYYEDVLKAVKAGYIVGNTDGTIRPEQNISNLEAAVIISRLLNLKSSNALDEAPRFKDDANIPQWGKSAVEAVSERGYMTGYSDGTFRPTQYITRAEVVAALDKCYLEHVKKTYDKQGTYSDGLVDGSVVIGAKDVTLQDMTINGNLILSEGIGDGNAYLKNIRVSGTTYIKGGGQNSINMENCSLGKVIIMKQDNKVRVLASGSTVIGNVEVSSGCRLEEAGITAGGFSTVVVLNDTPNNAIIQLSGDFDSVEIQADNIYVDILKGKIGKLSVAKTAQKTNISLASGVNIGNLVLDAPANITGNGTITSAQINMSGAVISVPVTNISKPDGVTVSIVNPSPASTGSAGSSGGGGGGGSSGSSGGSPSIPYVSIGSISSKTVSVNETISIGIVTDPSDASVSAQSSDTSKAVVIVSGHNISIKGVAPGIVTITVNCSRSDYRSNLISFTVTVDQPLTITPYFTLAEWSLNTNRITLALNNDTFKDNVLNKSNFIFNNAPEGLSVNMVTYLNATTATLYMNFNGTDFDSDIDNFNISILASETASNRKLTSNSLKIYANSKDVDTSAPRVERVTLLSLTSMQVIFDEAVDKTTAEDPSNYTFNNDLGNALSAILSSEDRRTVTITTKEHEPNRSYKITIRNIKDGSNNVCNITRNYMSSIVENDTLMPLVSNIDAVYDNELKVTFNERVQAENGARIAVSFGNIPSYADFVWVGNKVINNERTMVFKANKFMGTGDTVDQNSSFTGSAFTMGNGVEYTIEKISYVKDLHNNQYAVDSTDKDTFMGTSVPNDKPSVAAIEQINAKTIKIVFSEPLISPGGSIISADASHTVFNISDTDPEGFLNDEGYSTIELTIASGYITYGTIYKFDLSSVVGLTDFCGTWVKDQCDTDTDLTKYTEIQATYVDNIPPFIEYVEAVSNKRLKVVYNEDLQSTEPRYTIKNEIGNVVVKSGLKGYLSDTEKNVIYVPFEAELDTDSVYMLMPMVGAKDIAGNIENTVGVEYYFLPSSTPETQYISGVAINDAQTIEIHLNCRTAGNDSISVKEKDTDVELANQLTVENSIGYNGPTRDVTVTLKEPIMEDKTYIVTVGGTSVGASELCIPVSYWLDGIAVDGGLDIDNDGIITFSGWNVENYVVYVVYNNISVLVVPSSPTGYFNAKSIMDRLSTGQEYFIQVYRAVIPHESSGGVWTSEYAEYSEQNTDGFVKEDHIFYIVKFIKL